MRGRPLQVTLLFFSAQGDASAAVGGQRYQHLDQHQHQHQEAHASVATHTMTDLPANSRPDDVSANSRPENSADETPQLQSRPVQRFQQVDRHVDVPGICASNLESIYQLGEVMGKGSFAVVKTARRKRDGKMYAIKILEKTNPGESRATGLAAEREETYSASASSNYEIVRCFGGRGRSSGDAIESKGKYSTATHRPYNRAATADAQGGASD